MQSDQGLPCFVFPPENHDNVSPDSNLIYDIINAF